MRERFILVLILLCTLSCTIREKSKEFTIIAGYAASPLSIDGELDEAVGFGLSIVARDRLQAVVPARHPLLMGVPDASREKVKGKPHLPLVRLDGVALVKRLVGRHRMQDRPQLGLVVKQIERLIIERIVNIL